MRWIALALVMSGAVVMSAQEPVRTVESVDLDRYLGDWFEISRYENRFQDHCTGDVTATYVKRDDGRLDVINKCRTNGGEIDEAKGTARIVDTATNAKLKVRFAPAWLSFISAVWGDYWVIGLDPEYRWAVVGDPSRKYLWILSRTAAMDEASYKAAVERATANGFDASRLKRTPQEGTR